MKALGMAILLALTSASFVMALGPWDSDTARGAGSLEAQGRAGGLMMRWQPPATLPTDPLVGYQLRHRPQTTSQTPATWTTVDVGVVTSHRLTGLRNGTTYDVEVATRTAQGVGTFYASTTGTPGASQCESGTAVSDPASNPGLVEDCETLLGLKSELAGTATLNWSASTPVTSWEGVGVSRSPSRVTSLGLRYNQLTGSIPVELGQLSNLTFLSLGGNELTGSIPVELGQLSNLTTLSLDNDELTGSIPVELGQLSNLTSLGLRLNQLTGSIPVELGQLSNLRSLVLDYNRLTGSIPVELGQLSNLTSLGLHHNELTGSIPVELGQLSNLTSLGLDHNELTGSIPVELGQLSNLTSLGLHNNELTGSIPVELGQLSNLRVLGIL